MRQLRKKTVFVALRIDVVILVVYVQVVGERGVAYTFSIKDAMQHVCRLD